MFFKHSLSCTSYIYKINDEFSFEFGINLNVFPLFILFFWGFSSLTVHVGGKGCINKVYFKCVQICWDYKWKTISSHLSFWIWIAKIVFIMSAYGLVLFLVSFNFLTEECFIIWFWWICRNLWILWFGQLTLNNFIVEFSKILGKFWIFQREELNFGILATYNWPSSILCRKPPSRNLDSMLD